MTLITMQGDKVVMRAGAVGTEAACCCACICGPTVTARGNTTGARLEITLGNSTVLDYCLNNTSLTATSVAGGLPDGNKLPTPFADPSIAVWTCVENQYEIYTNTGTCFLTIYMSISHTATSDCATGDDFNFEITGWDNHGCAEAGAVVSIVVHFDC